MAYYDMTVYEIVGADGRRVVGGVWLDPDICAAAADADVHRQHEVRAIPVNDAVAPVG